MSSYVKGYNKTGRPLAVRPDAQLSCGEKRSYDFLAGAAGAAAGAAAAGAASGGV